MDGMDGQMDVIGVNAPNVYLFLDFLWGYLFIMYACLIYTHFLTTATGIWLLPPGYQGTFQLP
jgi:hypothetical protein